MKLEPPSDLDQLCSDLGVGLKRRAKLHDEHKENLLPWLQKMWLWAKAQDTDNFLHVNPGFGKSDYTDNPGKAARTADGSPEWAPPSDEIGQYRESVQARLRFNDERSERVGDLFGACRELRSAVEDLEPQVKRAMGRELWRLRSNLDALERKLRRQEAA